LRQANRYWAAYSISKQCRIFSRAKSVTRFSTDLHGKGIMSEAVALLTRYLFETTLLNRLEIHMEAGNTGSEKVAVKTAFNLKVSHAAHIQPGALSMSRCMPCCAANGKPLREPNHHESDELWIQSRRQKTPVQTGVF
jgi:hypothetical protein